MGAFILYLYRYIYTIHLDKFTRRLVDVCGYNLIRTWRHISIYVTNKPHTQNNTPEKEMQSEREQANGKSTKSLQRKTSDNETRICWVIAPVFRCIILSCTRDTLFSWHSTQDANEKWCYTNKIQMSELFAVSRVCFCVKYRFRTESTAQVTLHCIHV